MGAVEGQLDERRLTVKKSSLELNSLDLSVKPRRYVQSLLPLPDRDPSSCSGHTPITAAALYSVYY